MLRSTKIIGGIKRDKQINGLTYYPMFLKGASRVANLKADAFIETLVGRTITKQFERPLFRSDDVPKDGRPIKGGNAKHIGLRGCHPNSKSH